AFALSPDGTRIVVADGRKLLVRPVDGQPGLTVDVPGPAEDPSWSPDGTRVVYTSNYQIYVAPVGGGPVRQLTANGTVNGDATWTGEGDWVVFRSNRSGGGDLYAVKGSSSAGSETGLAQVTSTNERETTPAF
ncbi:MAG: Dipeptidyl peptidase N-terminal region, partial [Actinomycetota bacterium]|nr:Dipeptidyl peptidase N-terminal region [Actinomycetota bacterium]